MRSSKLKLLQSKLFWKAKYNLDRIKFYFSRGLFQTRKRISSEKEQANSLLVLLNITKGQLIVALLTAFGLYFLDPYSYNTFEHFGLTIKKENNSNYVSLFVAVSAIGGVFIALYYAGISSVSSTVYSNLPSNLRDLLTREKLGNFYIRYLSFITFLSLCIVALQVLGLPPIRLAVVIMIIMAGIGIIAFIALGLRTLNFFDPTHLSYSVFKDLRNYVTMVSVKGYQWNSASFQQYAHDRAKEALYTLDELTDNIEKRNHLNGKPFVDLSKYILSFLMIYHHQKKLIPSNSRWYKQYYVHKDWYLTDDSEITVAYDTGTFLQPTVKYDILWLENKALPLVLRCIKVNIEKGRIDLILTIINTLEIYLKTLSEQGELEQALDTLDKITEIVFEMLTEDDKKNVFDNESIEYLAIIDAITKIPTSLLLAYANRLKNLNISYIERRLVKVNWKRDKSLYIHNFALYTLSRLEWLKDRMRFELAVEGKTISPLWYQAELFAQVEVDRIKENTDVLFEQVAQYYEKCIQVMNKAKRPWLAAAIISNKWEYLNKLEYHCMFIFNGYKELSNNRHIKNLPWSEISREELEEKRLKREQTVLKLMSEQITVLSLTTIRTTFPDYIGQFLHITSGKIFEALCDNNHRVFDNLFKNFFFGSLMRYDKLRPETSEEDRYMMYKMKVAITPLVDLLELSGYAFLLSKYHNDVAVWNEIKRVWDNYFDKERSRVLMFASVIDLKNNSFEIGPRDILRTSWEQRIRNLFMSIPRRTMYGSRPYLTTEIVLHESPLVRIFAADEMGIGYRGMDIFREMYLTQKAEEENLQLQETRRDLKQAIEREEKKYLTYQNSLGEED